jgi:hypothetical protein
MFGTSIILLDVGDSIGLEIVLPPFSCWWPSAVNCLEDEEEGFLSCIGSDGAVGVVGCEA